MEIFLNKCNTILQEIFFKHSGLTIRSGLTKFYCSLLYK